MSRRRRSVPRQNSQPAPTMMLNNSLTDLSLQVASGTTGGSYLSSYNTQAFSNNYSLLTLNRIILTYMYTGNGIFQTAVQLPIQDAIGKGIEIDSGEMDNDDIDAVMDYWEENAIWQTILNAMTWTRLFGGGAILINTNQEPTLPLMINKNLMQTPIELYDIDRWQLDTNAAYFDEWDSYINAGNGMINMYGEQIHETRFLRLQGKRAPHYVRRQLRGWGMSEGERMIRDLNLYMKTQDATYELIDEAKIDIYKIQGLANKLLTAGGTSQIAARVQAANEIKNYVNALVLDSNEEYEQKQITFAGLAEVMQQNRIGVAAALRMPMTKLFGLSASGFNTGESDLENYNAMVESEVRSPLKPIIRKLLKITMAHLFGYVPQFTFKFPSLRELTPEIESQVKDGEYNRVMGLFDRGLMDAPETMQSLKKAGIVDIETKAEKGLVINPTPPNGTGAISDSALPGKIEADQEKDTSTVQNAKYRIIRKNSDFKEADHPRADDGKFGSGGGSSDSKKKESENFKEYETFLKDKYKGESIYAKASDEEIDKLEKLEKEYYKKTKEEKSVSDPKNIKLTKQEKKVLDYMTGNKKIPENIFLHGRVDKSDSIDTGFVIQSTQDTSVAEQYGKGSIWALELPSDAPDAKDIYKKVYKDLKKDKESGYTESDGDYYADFTIDEFKDAFVIDNILDAAQAWDNATFVAWFQNKYPNIDAVKFSNGHYGDPAAVFLNPEKIKKDYISRDKYNKTSEGYVVENSGFRIFRKKKNALADNFKKSGKYIEGVTPKPDEAELKEGIKIEMEHTSDKEVARQIALDHLTEDPRYYQKLKKAKL